MGNSNGGKPEYYTDEVDVKNLNCDGVPVRIYRPKLDSVGDSYPMPVVIYYHGGSYCYFGLDDYDYLAYILADKLKMVVINVDYTLAVHSPFPRGLEDSFKVLKYVHNNAKNLVVDQSRVILMGDSAGGGIITVMQKRIIEHNMTAPILFVPVYPWLNLVDYKLPSGMSNKKDDWKEVGDVFATITYVGIKQDKINKKMVEEIFEGKHMLLIPEVEERKKLFSYLDYKLVPEKYRTGHDNYKKFISDHEKLVEELTSSHAKLDENSELLKNKEFCVAALKCFNPEASPSFLDDSVLSKFPETYMIICEKDELKDENFIFAERLKRNSVKTTVAYSATGYHGIISDTYKNDEALRLFNDLIAYVVKKVWGV